MQGIYWLRNPRFASDLDALKKRRRAARLVPQIDERGGLLPNTPTSRISFAKLRSEKSTPQNRDRRNQTAQS